VVLQYAPRTPAARFGANVNLNRERRPSLWKACSGLRSGHVGSLERDLSEAAAGLFEWESAGNQYAIHLATDAAEYLAVLDEVGVRTPGSVAARYATRALGEGASALGSVTSAGALAPIQFFVGEFMLPLTGAQVLRQMPEVTVVPVTSNTTELPGETGLGTAQSIAENTGITASDITLTLAERSIRKAARLQITGRELYDDIGSPGADILWQRILGFELAAWVDAQELEGSGSGSNILGIRNFGSLTTSSWVAATNGSTPNGDDVSKIVQDIFTANATPTGLVMHPRTFFAIARLKDSTGAYVFPLLATAAATIVDYSKPRCVGTLWGAAVWVTTSVPITETQGSSNVATHIIAGDFSKLLIFARQGVELFASADYLLGTEQIAIRATIREAVTTAQAKAFSISTGII
jgi:HK97 family phage major capsid protein